MNHNSGPCFLIIHKGAAHIALDFYNLKLMSYSAAGGYTFSQWLAMLGRGEKKLMKAGPPCGVSSEGRGEKMRKSL